MFRRLLIIFAAGAVCGGVWGVPEWEDPAVNSINRLGARTWSVPLESVEQALTNEVRVGSKYVKSLNGVWKVAWCGNPALRVKDFWREDFDDRDFYEIDVPSCLERRGFGSCGYTNVRYPFANAAPRILDRVTKAGDYNPVGSYRKEFEIGEEWAGREVILRFDGVGSAYYVWVNGERVGYAEDSKLPSEFDITKYVKVGKNLLAVEVYRWCDGSYLEDQDMMRYSGIYRDVMVWSRPKDGIWDFVVRTKLKGDYRDGEIWVEGCDYDACELYDAEKKLVAKWGRDGARAPNPLCSGLAEQAAAKRGAEIRDVRLWSAEKPYLYTLVIRKGEDIRRKWVGFKEQKVVGNRFLVNGKAIKLKGVNRHETDAEEGRAVSYESMVRDIEMMKRYNFNTVRTSHYANHHWWYDLCDLYGMYVVAEANMEGHEPGYGEEGLGKKEMWAESIRERNVRHVEFYRNNVSVTMWSIGNETGHGEGTKGAIRAARELDGTRPVHWERGNVDADVDSCMYWEVDRVGELGKLAGEAYGSRTYRVMDGGEGSLFTAGKPKFLCEYAHAMGNACGEFDKYWEMFYKYDGLMGGCVWEWAEHAVWKRTGRVDEATGEEEKFLAVGGDFDEEPNDGPFCADGIVNPLREVSAKLIEIGHVQRNLVVRKSAAGKLEVENRFGFTWADEFKGTWTLVKDGREMERGSFEVPHIGPLEKGEMEMPRFRTVVGGDGEWFLNVAFRLKEGTRWGEENWVVARDQVKLAGEFDFGRAVEVASGDGVRVREEAGRVVVEAGETVAVFCRATGALAELKMNGKDVLMKGPAGIVVGPELTVLRAFVDNDWYRGEVYRSGLTQAHYHGHGIRVEGGKVRTHVTMTGSKSAGFEHKAEWTFGADGSIVIENWVEPFGTQPEFLPRFGLTMRLDGAYEEVAYYGRGPWENYADRKSGSFFGEWRTTVRGMFVNYTRPQDNGYRSDVRWVTMRDEDGRGVKFTVDRPFYFQAMHYGWEDLEGARHRNGEVKRFTPLVERKEIFVNVDVRQMPLGGASCGPGPMEEARLRPGKEHWVMKMAPVK